MNSTDIIGIIASVFTAISLLPQLVKIFKEKNAEGTSWLLLISLFIGVSFWIIYGVRKDDPIIIISNAFALAVNITVMIFSIRYRKASHENVASQVNPNA